MIRKLDLAAIAEGIDTAYRPVPLATLGLIEASIFICQGRTPWQRDFAADELLFVLEGVINLDSGRYKLVVNEGELVSAPGDRTYSSYSGMRSTVVIFEDHAAPAQSRNGHHPDAVEPTLAVSKTNAAVECRRRPPFEWLDSGEVGTWRAVATRLRGRSLPYQVGADPVALLVYRGVLDYSGVGEEGTVVGSQMLVVPSRVELTLSSERGATVIIVVPASAPAPESAAADPADGQDVEAN